MSILRILVPLHTLPDVKSLTTIFFENLLPVLKTKIDVHILWLVYTPERLDSATRNYSGYTILDIHDYENAVDVIEKEKPDLIYASETWNFIDHALSSAARFLNIPAFCMVHSDIAGKKETKKLSSSMLRFFQSSIPTDTKQNKKKFMRRGRFYLYKYVFLLKTKIATKKDIFQTLFTIWKFIIKDEIDPRFAPDVIQFLENESLLIGRMNMKFKKSNLIVTGNPIYDAFFWKLQNNTSLKKDKKISILFTPSTLYEHGFWTKAQNDFVIKDVITKIVQNKEEMSLMVKIHPSSANLSEYQSIINVIDTSIPIYQKGTIDDFLGNVDIVISSFSSTAEVYAMLAKIPIVIYNPFDSLGDVLLERNLAIDCKESSLLIQTIHKALSSKSTFENNREPFIKEFMFKWDGRAGERICEEIIKLIEKSHSVK